MEGDDNQGTGEHGRPVRHNMYWGCRPRFHRGPTCQRQPKDSLERMAMKKIRKIKEIRPRSAATSTSVLL